MGRRIPSESNSSISSALSLSLIAFSIISTISMTVFLCGTRSKKSKPRRSSPQSPSSPTTSKEPEPSNVTTVTLALEKSIEKAQLQQEQETLPLPPKLKEPPMLIAAPKNQKDPPMITSMSKRKLTVSFSMKVPATLSKIRTGKEEKQKHEEKSQEALWKKQIILGEKCRVPINNEDDPVVYDDKGNRLVAYTPRMPRSLPVSRQSSFIDMDAISVPKS